MKTKASPSNAEISEVLHTGYVPDDRTIYLFDEINDQTAYRFTVAFNLLDKTKGDITIKLCSSGGEEGSGYAIFDTIKEASNHIIIEGYGKVHSMAVLVLQAGDERWLSPETRLMIHCGDIHLGGESVDIRTLNAFSKESLYQLERYVDLLAQRSSIDAKKIEEWMYAETFFSAYEAVKLGLADHIITR